MSLSNEDKQWIGDALESRIGSRTASLEKLIVNVKESLERDIHGLETKLEQRFDAMEQRFGDQASRLDRQAGLIQTGSRWTRRSEDWQERTDKLLEAKDTQILDLIRSMEKIEARLPPPPQQ